VLTSLVVDPSRTAILAPSLDALVIICWTMTMRPNSTIPKIIRKKIGATIANYKRKVRKDYGRPLPALEGGAALTLYSPPENPPVPPRISALLDNPLGIPLPDDRELYELISYYAPKLEQEVTKDYDLPGEVVWEGSRISIDTRKPTIYYYATHMLYQGRPMLQLNYVLWYTRRPPIYWADVEAGRIHGLTFRMTLEPSGKLIMADVIHNCGCYHFFFPSRESFGEPRNNLFREDALVPQWLPLSDAPSRLTVRIGTQKHFVQRLYYGESASLTQKNYQLLPYELLEALPKESGKKESIFTPEGIVKGETERPERFLLFSVGIAKIGSMRQRGHQDTALIGERTFDDPRLFEHYFHLP
jgi:hypothetical protein